MADKILEVKNLVSSFQTENGRVTAVDGVSFSLSPGETLGIVGESGCGKSVTALSMLRLLPRPAGRIDSGEVILAGQDILKLSLEDMFKIRGRRVGMIFQEPMTALNPVKTVGQQVMEVFDLHFPELSEKEKRFEVIDIFERVGIPAPRRRFSEFPHQLSGGLRQRVMIALALACKPEVLIADEPTTALDVTIQAQILDLIADLQKEIGMGVIFITHDLGVVAQICDSVTVMYAGRVAEQADVFDLFKKPTHPYTKGLLDSIPTLNTPPKSKLEIIEGMVPSLADMPKACRFQNRCDFVQDKCKQSAPNLEECGAKHHVSCFRWNEI